MGKCEICKETLRNGRLKTRHVKCQKKIIKKIDSCIECDERARKPTNRNIFCDRHYRHIDDIYSYLHRPETSSMQDAVEYFLRKGKIKGVNCGGFLMPDGIFYHIYDEHIESVKDINYSISSNHPPTIEWFLTLTGAIYVYYGIFEARRKEFVLEYYDINSTQINAIQDVLCRFTPEDYYIEINGHCHKSAKYLKRIIDNSIGCRVEVFN